MMDEPNQNYGELDPQVEVSKPVATLGSMLREARERLGLSVGDVANQIKFAPRQIEALEADDFSAKPEATFLRGFVRSYGKLLHLDEDVLFAALPETKVTTLSAVSVQNQTVFPNTQSSVRKHNFVWMSAALLLVVVALGFAIFNGTSPVQPETDDQAESKTDEATVEAPVALPDVLPTVSQQVMDQPVAASSVQPIAPTADIVVKVAEVVAPKPKEVKLVAPPTTLPQNPKVTVEKTPEKSPVPDSAPAGAGAGAVAEAEPPKATVPIDMLLGITPAKPAAQTAAAFDIASELAGLHIVFGEESWTDIRDKTGKSLSSKINPGGSELRIEGTPPFAVVIANARSARLYYKGKQVGLEAHIKKYGNVARLTLE